MGKNILITGGSGFIGSHVVSSLLDRGYEVTSLVNSKYNPERDNLTQIKLDITDLTAVTEFFKNNKFEYLMHFAWYMGNKCHVHNNNLDWVITSLNLLKLFKETGGKVFLGAGSVSEYEYKYGYLTESQTPTCTKILYGESKNAFYKIAKTYCKQNGISFKWPRIFNLYGPGEKLQRLMPSVINSCLKGEDVKVSSCLKYQDYLYVEDTANAIVDIFESDMEEAVNVCSGKPVQLREIVNKIVELTDFKGNILWGAVPSAFGDEVVVGNNAKLKSIGWEQKYNLEEGLIKTIDWWKTKNKEKINV